MESKKNVYQITVFSHITDSVGEVNEMTLYTEATYKHEQKKAYLMYDETEISGLEKTKTLVSYDGKMVQIKRFGANSSVLKIEIDEMHENSYQTPYGTFIMRTTGKSIHWNDSDGLRIELKYLLEIEGDSNSPSEVRIKIETKRA